MYLRSLLHQQKQSYTSPKFAKLNPFEQNLKCYNSGSSVQKITEKAPIRYTYQLHDLHKVSLVSDKFENPDLNPFKQKSLKFNNS